MLPETPRAGKGRTVQNRDELPGPLPMAQEVSRTGSGTVAPQTYAVWFEDGQHILTDANSEEEAKRRAKSIMDTLIQMDGPDVDHVTPLPSGPYDY